MTTQRSTSKENRLRQMTKDLTTLLRHDGKKRRWGDCTRGRSHDCTKGRKRENEIGRRGEKTKPSQPALWDGHTAERWLQEILKAT